jgi:hypothetical protein
MNAQAPYCIVICGLPGCVILFSNYHVNDAIIGKKKIIENEMCVLSFYTTFSEAYLILRRSERDTIKNLYWSKRVNYPLFLSYFNETRVFSDRFSKHSQTLNFLKFRLLGAELFHANGRLDRYDETKTAFRNFSKARNTIKLVLCTAVIAVCSEIRTKPVSDIST